MKQQALGMIETIGLIAAVEAGDAGLKAANVTFLGYELVKGGLVTVTFAGEVAAVKASVSAASAAAAKIGTVVSEHVIPRLEPDFRMIFKGNKREPIENHPDTFAKEDPISTFEIAITEAEARTETAETNINSIEMDKGTGPYSTQNGFDDELDSMTVGQLRKLARKTPGIAIHGRVISRSNKEQLILAIRRARDVQA